MNVFSSLRRASDACSVFIYNISSSTSILIEDLPLVFQRDNKFQHFFSLPSFRGFPLLSTFFVVPHAVVNLPLNLFSW